MININEYNKIREATQSFYQKINFIRCPALNHQPIHFQNDGFRHLIYKGNKKKSERDKRVQLMKFKLFPKAKDIIKITTTYQEYEEGLIEIIKKRKKKKVKESVIVKYWGFVAIIDNFRVKVVVRQIGNGNKHFWSTIPAWSKSHYRNIKILSKSKGNLEED